MKRRGKGKFWFIVGIIMVVVLVVVAFFYFALVGPNYEKVYAKRIESGELINPAEGLSLEEAIEQFDEDYVEYLMVDIKAYNLHNPPLSSDSPEIELLIGDEEYNAEIIRGEIIIEKGQIVDEDLIILTTKEEAVKALQDSEYLVESFKSGKSKIELVAGNSELFGKGYLKLYNKFTGKTATGNVVRIFVG
jgi:hypothetical protein